ncbi:hypothetical protein EDB83DRAFT_2322582 [Lactarius deliciosus]|nr:hypothetical protein EDB83DRAFT_2322582 [Lactarius deliciosus]
MVHGRSPALHAAQSLLAPWSWVMVFVLASLQQLREAQNSGAAVAPPWCRHGLAAHITRGWTVHRGVGLHDRIGSGHAGEVSWVEVQVRSDHTEEKHFPPQLGSASELFPVRVKVM